MAHILRSLKLSTRVLLVVLALFVASIWGLATRVTAMLQTDLEKVVSAQMSATVDYVAADIDAKLRLRIALLNEIAASITPDILADPAKAQRLLDQRGTSPALFPNGITVTNAEGTAIAEYPRIEGRLGGSLRDRDYFQEVMAGAKQAIGRPVLGRFSKHVLVGIAVPLHDASGRVAGALLGPVYPSDPNMFGRLEETKIGNSSYFIVASPKDGVIVSATDKSRILQPMPAPGANPLFDRRLQGFEGTGRTISTTGVDVLSANRNIKTSGWMVIAAIPTEEAFAPIAAMKHQIYLAALVMSLLVMAILYFVLQRQLAPLKQATTAMRRMTEGTAAFAPLPGEGPDEIGLLLTEFNRLAIERSRLDESLRRSGVLLDSLPLAVRHADKAERITYANRAYRALLGGEAPGPVGCSVREVLGEQRYASMAPNIRRALAGEEIEVAREFVRDDGSTGARSTRYLPDRDAAGEVVGFFALIEDISKRKQAEAALQASEAWFRSVFENANTGIASTDRSGRVSSFNESFRAMLGYDAETLRRMKFSDFTHPDDLKLEIVLFDEILARKREHYRVTKRYIAADGSIVWIDLSTAVVRNAQGEAVNFVGVVHDITDRIRIESALIESEERQRLVVENLAEGVVVQDAQGQIVSANQAAQRILALSAAQLFGRSSIDPRWRAIREDGSDLPGELHPAMETLRTGEPQTEVIMGVHKPDGTLTWLSINSRLLPSLNGSRTRGVVTSFIDVTGHKSAAAHQRLAASVFDHAAEAIMITDRNNDIISVNRAFSEITGYSEEEVIGKNPRLLSSGMQNPDFYEVMWDSIGKKGRWNGEIWDRRKNGDAYCEQLSISTVRDANGDIANYCSMFADITARKNAEAALQRLNAELEQRVFQRTEALEQANSDLQSFSYSISHDLRAPLRAINGFSAMVLAEGAGKLDQETMANLGNIATAAERMGRIIDDLLSLSQVSRKELHRQAVNLSELASEVASNLAQSHPTRQVDLQIAPDMMVDADRGLVQITLENLIGNAWKFTSRTNAARIEVGQQEGDGETIYFVRDNGAGFDMHYADKLFRAFQRLHTTREFEGTGIGLSIVQRVVTRHGGRIWAEAEPGKGATLHFTLAAGRRALPATH